jgi:signal transduction histidine kinase
MTPRLCIFSCDNFHLEVAACVRAEGWADVVSTEFPARCGRPPIAWDELQNVLPQDCTQVILFGRACLGALGPAPASFPPVQRLIKEQCFHLIASPTLVDTAIAEASYLMSPGWLRNWRSHVAEQGFTPETAGDFYRDFAKQLVLLDTGVEPDVARYAEEFACVTGLPLQRLAVGLDHMRLLLGNAVLEWRLAQSLADSQQHDRSHGAELADHVCAMDLLGRLTQLRQEAEVIAAIEDLFRMLFAPRLVQYQRFEASQRSAAQSVPSWLQSQALSPHSPYVWTTDGNGFALLFAHDGQEVGRITIDGLAFCQYRERYLNLALAMSGVCALALESARTRKRLVEAEKMASLGVMVAGIAHEINTPVGVSVLAASTVQRDTQKLAQSFAERRMTQSSLQTYLSDAQSQNGLILSNLQRVGTLIDAFRQVAVNGLPQTTSPVRLSRCIKDVIASLGDRINGQQFQVRIDCDEMLAIESYPGDWASIFTNLIANSLQHGFKGQEKGQVDISVIQDSKKLLITYADDGVGLTPEGRKRIFDPFFTTDLQNGMGLGMHLVYNLVTQRMGGTITCPEPIANGAIFQIEVPTLSRLPNP